MLGSILAVILISPVNPGFDSGFADYLYENGEYEQAATEYLRVIYENDSDTLSCPLSALRLARCFQEMNLFTDAFDMYVFLSLNLENSELRSNAHLGAGSILEESGNFAGAREYYLEAGAVSSDPELSCKSDVLAALMLGRLDRWDEASTELSILSTGDGIWSTEAGRLTLLAETGENLPRRSPFWCGLSSAIIPGAGQIFCGRTKDGIIALGMNAVMGYLFYQSLTEDNIGGTVLFGWLSLSFYGGNIYGGIRAADTWNSARERELFEQISRSLEDVTAR